MDHRRDVQRIADVIVKYRPHVVCLQEVHQRLPWSGWDDQPKRLAHGLGMPLVFQSNVHFLGGGYGLGIAASLPINAVQRIRLPSVRERRGLLCVAISTSKGDLQICCTHWGLGQEERMHQAAAAAAWIKKQEGDVILCGDLNEGPEGPAVRRLLTDAPLYDAGEASDLPTYPAINPTARIDYCFCTPGVRVFQTVVPQTEASDHLPIFCDIAL
jgi:endonuclease/exonuclease/phosphatase family metal-dependent hydrolase